MLSKTMSSLVLKKEEKKENPIKSHPHYVLKSVFPRRNLTFEFMGIIFE